MIRVAAIADVHFSADSRGRLRDHWSQLHQTADVLLIGGDLIGTAPAYQWGGTVAMSAFVVAAALFLFIFNSVNGNFK